MRVIHALQYEWYPKSMSWPDFILDARGHLFFPIIRKEASEPLQLQYARQIIHDLSSSWPSTSLLVKFHFCGWRKINPNSSQFHISWNSNFSISVRIYRSILSMAIWFALLLSKCMRLCHRLWCFVNLLYHPLQEKRLIFGSSERSTFVFGILVQQFHHTFKAKTLWLDVH